MRSKTRWLALLLAAFAAILVDAGTGTGHTMRRPATHVSARTIRAYRAQTWRWQALMGVRRTRGPRTATPVALRFWRRHAFRALTAAAHPPHGRAWLCIHRYEGAWNDDGDPYWGGLQMDRGFMYRYAAPFLLRRGLANRWSPVEQMWVAERAFRNGRGYYPWPNTARSCGLL